MKKTDGTYVTVELDASFKVTGTVSGFGAGPAGGKAPTGTPPSGKRAAPRRGRQAQRHPAVGRQAQRHPADAPDVVLDLVGGGLRRRIGSLSHPVEPVPPGPVTVLPRRSRGRARRRGEGDCRLAGRQARAGGRPSHATAVCRRTRQCILETYSSAYLSTSARRRESIFSGLSDSDTSASIQGAHSRSVTPASSRRL